jgi:hypothetical protein
MAARRSWDGLMKRVLQGILVVAVGFVTGKWCQYAAVEYLGDRLGFNCASVIGLSPFMVGIVYLRAKYPHILDHRKRVPGR